MPHAKPGKNSLASSGIFGYEDSNVIDLASLRKSLGLTQAEFWGAIKVRQSCGSRYENGNKVPPAILELVRLKYSLKNAIPKPEHNSMATEARFRNQQLEKQLRRQFYIFFENTIAENCAHFPQMKMCPLVEKLKSLVLTSPMRIK